MTHVKAVPNLGWTRKSVAVSLLLAVEAHQREMGERLAALREERGLTQEELAHKAGLSNKTVSRLENGHHEPELDTLRKLAKALDVQEVAIRGQPPAPLGMGETQLDRIESAISALEEQVQLLRAELTVRDAEALQQASPTPAPRRRSQQRRQR